MFARVVDGIEVAMAISGVEVDDYLKPVEDILIREVFMLVPPDTVPPVARVEAVPDVEVGEVVVLDGSNSTDDVGVVNWTWSYDEDGEGTTLYGPVAVIIPLLPGNYTVNLTVRDEAGNSATQTVTFNVLPVDMSQDDDEGLLGYALLIVIFFIVIVAVGLLTRKRV